jgi:glycosyltransferase involved in cell wall biosynthesis
MFVSFCIITNGSKSYKTNLCIKSIHNNFRNNDDYEIIVVGNNLNTFKGKGCELIEDNEFIEFLGKRKNIAFENSKGDIIVHCDDDILFPPDWLENFKIFNQTNKDWQIMGNKILLPDSGRYWDRAIYFPLHHMVEYNYESNSDIFYQTGCFSVCKRSLLENIKWDNNIPYYGMFKGFKHNEDIDFSLRLNEKEIKIFFDSNNTVWHYDYTYLSDGTTCNKKQNIDYVEYKCLNFIKLLNNLSI